MAAKQNMTVEEILAACRRADGGETVSEPTVSPAQAPVEEASGPPDSTPAAEVSPPGKKASEMSVAEMLAAARSEKASPAAAPQKAAAGQSKASSQASASPKAPAKAKAPKAAEKGKSAVPRDTSSILAAARKEAKPGPISKAEAAARSREAAPASGKPKIVAPPLPEKPAYAVAGPADGELSEDRRTFMSGVLGTFVGSFLAVGFTSLGLTHLLWVLGFARFMFPNIRIEPPSEFRVGFPDDFAPGQVETKFKAQFGVWIVRDEYDGQAQIFALKTVCTHLGCTPNWLEGEQKFKCPCHGSGFYKDGVNFEGPAPRPLERYGISLAADGQLVVDKSKQFNEEKGQWTDASSFVPV